MTRRATRRHGPLLAAPVLVLAVLTACSSGSSGPSSVTSGSSSGGASASASSAGAVTGGSPAVGGDGTPVPAATAPLAPVRTAGDARGNRVEFAPVSLHREGDLLALDLDVHNVTPAGRGDGDYNIAFVFMGTSAAFDNVSLVDTKNRKRHLVVDDSKGSCLCTSFFGGLTVPRGGRVALAAYFAAPPPDVTAMDVVLGKQGTFPAVRIG